MTNDLVKRFLTKDRNTRISIIQDEYAENPRDTTDEPLHCEDWSQNYSIMTSQERQTKSDNACGWVRYMLERYGNLKAIIKVLRENAKADKHSEGDNALTYDASRHEWIISSWIDGWTDAGGEKHGDCWGEDVSWAVKIKDLRPYHIVEYLSDDMIDVFADKRYFTDGIKIGSYSFGYYGGISFCDSFSVDSEGICWLEKDEFLKYAGGDNSEWVKKEEQVWKEKSLDEIEFLLGEIEAWADGEVYGFKVEKKHRFKLHKEYIDEDKEDEDTEDEEWEETDSCLGFYGELDKSLDWILGTAGFKIEELEEVA